MEKKSWCTPAKCSPFRPTCRTRPRRWKIRLISISSILRAPIGSTRSTATCASNARRCGKSRFAHLMPTPTFRSHRSRQPPADEGVRGSTNLLCYSYLSAMAEPASKTEQAFSQLRCIGCGKLALADRFRCEHCRDLLEIIYPGWKESGPGGLDSASLKQLWRDRRSSLDPSDQSGVWRFREILPEIAN